MVHREDFDVALEKSLATIALVDMHRFGIRRVAVVNLPNRRLQVLDVIRIWLARHKMNLTTNDPCTNENMSNHHSPRKPSHLATRLIPREASWSAASPLPLFHGGRVVESKTGRGLLERRISK